MIKGVNRKYVDLLQKTYDKFKNVDFIVYSEKDHLKTEKPLVTEKTLKLSSNPRKRSINCDRKHPKAHNLQHFSPAEDKILLDAIKNGIHRDYQRFAKLLNRQRASVRSRIMKLERSKSTQRAYMSFSSKEDFSLIDVVVRNIKNTKSLDLPIKELENLAAELGRDIRSVYFRWDRKLKIWLLQHHHKTLNLEVRPMLANLIAENYSDIDDIQWDKILDHTEFLGHTESSLSSIFTSSIVINAEKHTGKSRHQLTLKEIADDANESYKNVKVKEGVSRRQTEVISYFEKLLKEKNIIDINWM